MKFQDHSIHPSSVVTHTRKCNERTNERFQSWGYNKYLQKIHFVHVLTSDLKVPCVLGIYHDLFGKCCKVGSVRRMPNKPGDMHSISYKFTCSPSEDSDQPVHLIASVQADQSLRCPPEETFDPWLRIGCSNNNNNNNKDFIFSG